MALEQRPLASVIAQPKIRSPRQLDGQTVGVTGDPSDLAVLRSVVAGAGGKPSAVKTITIGYNAVPDLIAVGWPLRQRSGTTKACSSLASIRPSTSSV